MPADVGVVDTMIGFPHADLRGAHAEIREQIRDRQTPTDFEMPVAYMFKAVPEKGFAADLRLGLPVFVNVGIPGRGWPATASTSGWSRTSWSTSPT